MARAMKSHAPAPSSGLQPAVFVDRDGTLIENLPYNVDPARVHFTPGAVAGLQRLVQAGFRVCVVTNQPGIGLGVFDAAALTALHASIAARLAGAGVPMAGFYVCPHAAGSGCACRKPAPTLLQRAAADLRLDLARSWMVGDILDDVEAGNRAGCATVLLDVGNETEWRAGALRQPTCRVGSLLHAAHVILASRSAAEHDASRPC
jgi:histidinol-phosphate phosphatase family protein